MPDASAKADWDHWPGRLAALAHGVGQEPSDDALRQAAELGRAVGRAGVPLADVAVAPWTVVREPLRRGATSEEVTPAGADRVARRFLEGYAAAIMEATAQAESRYRAIVEDQTDLICRFQADGTLTFVNGAYARHFGSTPAELVGRSLLSLIPERYHSAVRQHLAGFTPAHAVQVNENPAVRPDGSATWQHWVNRAFFADDGQLLEFQSVGRDISDRRQAEVELQRQREELEALVAQRTRELTDVNARLQEELAFTKHLVTGVPAIVCRITPEGTTRFVNPAGERITGYRADELIGRNWLQVFYPGEEYRQVERLFEAFRRGDVRDYQMVLTTKTGQKRTVSWNSVNRFGPDGRILEIIGFGEDVTERSQAELAVRESEERFRQLAENITGYFWLYELATQTTLYVGPGYERIWGCARDDLYADPNAWMRAVHPDDRAAVVAGRDRQMRGDSMPLEYRIVRPDGAVRWVRNRVFLIRDAAGAAQRLAGIVEDITEQKRSEREVRVFKTVSDEAGYGSAIVDMEGKITYVNTAFAAMHGRTREELLGQPLSVFHSAAQLPRVEALNERLRQGGRYVTEEVWHVRADGSEFPTLMSGIVLRDEQGRPEFMAATAIDITDRERAEVALRESKEFLDEIINCIGDPIFVKDRQHRMVLVNDAECALTGHPRAEVLGQTDYGFFPKEQVDVFWEKDDVVLQTGQENINEEEITDAQGSTRTIVTKKTRYTDPAGNQFLVGVIRDITDRKRAEEALRASEAKFRTLAETVAVGIGITHGPRLAYVNATALNMLGYSREELMALEPLWKIIHPDHRAMVRERDAARERGEFVPPQYELKYVTKSGETRWAALSATRIEYEGQPAVLATSVDITERKRVEDALRTSEARFRTLAETIPVAITITSGPRVLYVNSAAEAITGYDRAELMALTSYWNVVHPDFRELVRDRGEVRERREAVPSRYEIKLLRKGGEERWVELSASYFEFDGAPATLAAGIDITERKLAEEQVRQHQEQLTHVARVATVGEMASGLAHELSQPLTAILYFARGCSRRLQTGTRGTTEALDTLQKIAAQAERAGEFVRRLKAFVRKAAPQRVPADLNAIVQEALTLAGADLRSKHVAVRLELAENLPEVRVDPLQIEQVLLNLVRNAVDAMEATLTDERELWIRTHAGPQGTICVGIRDTGSGLTTEVAEHAFDPFFTTKPAGTGLGLSISRTIIEDAHGGMLWLKPDARGGANAGFSLPAGKGDAHGGK